jgi:hypothetical protein
MNIDFAKTRREQLRWLLLLALNYARPSHAHEILLLGAAQGVYADATDIEVRRELGHLEGNGLVTVERNPAGFWTAILTSSGIDCVEYTDACPKGIARPEKYWAGA